jgi:Putative beta-barrel porin-2, OmpL-like. bbp2
MNRTTKHLSKWATAMLAVGFAVACAPISRADDQPSDKAASQPAPASQPTTAPEPATAPAAAPQPTADQRLQELEKEVNLLQQEIASLKADSTPGIKTAALTQPASFNPPAAADDAPQKISISSLLGPVTLSGFGDVYYGYDANHPGDNQSGLRFFEAPTNGFAFNMAELILDKPPDATSADSRLGYHVSAGYGQAAKVINGSDAPFSDGSNFFLKEAYLSYLAPVGKGLTITVGKFVTNAGEEVIESNANWNYSRSILFYYAIPFFHFGAKASYTFNPKWSVNASLVNGWNNTEISHASGPNGFNSSGLTYGGTVAYTPNMKWSASENYYGGPVIIGANADGTLTNNAWRHLSDTVIGYTPNAKWAFALNGDAGAVILTPKNFTWWGVAGYAKYTFSPKTNFALRYEYYDDPDGYTGILLGAPGFAQEVTATYSHNLTSGLLVRGEYRYDFGQVPIFQDGPTNFVKEENTAYLSFVYSFSSANLK